MTNRKPPKRESSKGIQKRMLYERVMELWSPPKHPDRWAVIMREYPELKPRTRAGAKNRLNSTILLAEAIAYFDNDEERQRRRARVLYEAERLAFSNMRDFIDPETGQPVTRFDGLSSDVMAALSSLSIDETTTGEGESKTVTRKVRFRISGKQAALELLAKADELYPDTQKLELSGPDGGPIETTSADDIDPTMAARLILATFRQAKEAEKQKTGDPEK